MHSQIMSCHIACPLLIMRIASVSISRNFLIMIGGFVTHATDK